MTELPEIRPGRVHEATGSGRRGFAAAVAAHALSSHRGPAIWIAPPWSEALCPDGLADFFDPGRLIRFTPEGKQDLWWCMEEALRSGAAACVVAEVEQTPDLTRSRRLQLAAEAGRATGLVLFTGRPTANAAETRWHITPLPGAGRRQEWRCLKNKRGVTGAWEIALGTRLAPPSEPSSAPSEPRVAREVGQTACRRRA